MFLPELNQLARCVASPVYKIDLQAKKMGFKVVWLPPYHSMLNPIELAWAQVKGYVARNNREGKVQFIPELIKKAEQKIQDGKHVFLVCVGSKKHTKNNAP